MKVDDSECLQQCSGVLVTSYEQQEIEDITNVGLMKLVKYLSRTNWDFRKESFKGYKPRCLSFLLLLLNFRIRKKIRCKRENHQTFS